MDVSRGVVLLIGALVAIGAAIVGAQIEPSQSVVTAAAIATATAAIFFFGAAPGEERAVVASGALVVGCFFCASIFTAAREVPIEWIMLSIGSFFAGTALHFMEAFSVVGGFLRGRRSTHAMSTRPKSMRSIPPSR